MSLYLLLDLLAIAVPLAFSFEKRLQFYKLWSGLFISILIVGTVYVIWDAFFTQWGVWGFNDQYILGFKIGNLPLEEYLFFICVPYASVFTFHVFKTLMTEFTIKEKVLKNIVFILSTLLIIGGFVFHLKWYTSSTCFFAGISLIVSYYFFRTLLPHFFLSYAAILLPFFIMNGILTGMWIDKEVVWYNNDENLGIRLMTIPLEDVFYGMALILWNINLTFRFAKRAK